MKYLLLIFLLTGCATQSYVDHKFAAKHEVYSKKDIDAHALKVGREIQAIKEHLFPEAFKLAKEKNCNIDIKTKKCIEEKNGK